MRVTLLFVHMDESLSCSSTLPLYMPYNLEEALSSVYVKNHRFLLYHITVHNVKTEKYVHSTLLSIRKLQSDNLCFLYQAFSSCTKKLDE